MLAVLHPVFDAALPGVLLRGRRTRESESRSISEDVRVEIVEVEVGKRSARAKVETGQSGGEIRIVHLC